MPIAKPAQDACVPLEVRYPLRLQQDVVVVQRVRRLVVAVLRELVHRALGVAPQPRAQKLMRDVDVKVTQLALGLLSLRLDQRPMDLGRARIHRQAFQFADSRNRPLQLVRTAKRNLEVVDGVPGVGDHLGEQRGLVDLLLPLLRLRQHREQPVEFVGRRRVVEAPREASRVDPEILWQVHEPESTMPLTHLRTGHKKPRPEAVGVLFSCLVLCEAHSPPATTKRRVVVAIAGLRRVRK